MWTNTLRCKQNLAFPAVHHGDWLGMKPSNCCTPSVYSAPGQQTYSSPPVTWSLWPQMPSVALHHHSVTWPRTRRNFTASTNKRTGLNCDLPEYKLYMVPLILRLKAFAAYVMDWHNTPCLGNMDSTSQRLPCDERLYLSHRGGCHVEIPPSKRYWNSCQGQRSRPNVSKI